MKRKGHIYAESESKTKHDFPCQSATFSVWVQQHEDWKLINNNHIDISQNLICEQNGCVDVKMDCPTSDATLNMKLVNTSSETRKQETLLIYFTFPLGKGKQCNGATKT